ncbi:MAG: hypothetical protein HY767_02945, partial [Candidatus Omnitrophica bacterium]|nr:hypothetical protein [Candidatus Omnitrophota bacterium]
DRHHPDGPRVSYSTSLRASRQDVQNLLYNPDGSENTSIAMLPGEREIFMSVFNDPEFAHNPFYLAIGSNDAFNVTDRQITSKAYQVSARDGDTTHSLMVDDRVPEGYPVVTYQRSERMRLADIAGGDVRVFNRNTGTYEMVHVDGILNDPASTMVPPLSTVLDTGLTLEETLRAALSLNPFANFTMTTSNYYFAAGSTTAEAGSVAYSWSSRDNNRNFSLSINNKAPDGSEMTFSETQRVSHESAIAVAGQITDPEKKAEALVAI